MSATPAPGRRCVPVAVLAAVIPLVATALTACSPPPAGDDCAWMQEPSQDRDHGGTVILVDTSASTSGAGPEALGRDYTNAVDELLDGVIQRRDGIWIGGFSGSSPDIDWTVSDWSTDWSEVSDNDTNQERLRQEANDCLTAKVSQAQNAMPRQAGSDVLAAMRSAAAVLRELSGSPRELIVLTDGLSTSGCADLQSAGFEDDAEIDAIVDVCVEREEITHQTLRGLDTVLLGVGQPAPDHPVPTAAQQAWLTRLWQRLCAGGRTGPDGEGCAVRDVPVEPEARPGGDQVRQTGSVAEDPVIRFGDGRVQTYVLPGAVLFDSNSATVREAAIPLLTSIAVDIRSTSGAEVTVNGYVDPRGDPGNNLQLSQARSDAVGEVLRDLGVRDLESNGLGVATDCPREITGDLPERDPLQCDRRVDIVVTR
jgi:OOP family OmpA-OmpF porin